MTGTILDTAQVDTFGLQVPPGGAVVFVRGLQSCDATRPLLMQLYDPSGVYRDVSQVCRGLGREVLATHGRWTITVTGTAAPPSKADTTFGTGPYRFLVSKIGTDASGTTALDRTVSGTLRAAGQIDKATLPVASAGEIIYVRGPGCTPQSPAITVVLKNPSGVAVNLGRACQGFGRQRLTEVGNWTFEVSGSDAATGDYRFEVLGVRPDRVVTLKPGQRLSGIIEAPGVNDIFTLDATAAQIVYIRSLEPCSDANQAIRLLLVAPSGVTFDIARACDGLRREVFRFAGIWKLVASGDYDATGTYRLEVLGVRPDLKRPITVGSSVDGAIEQVGAQDRWTFHAAAGDKIRIQGSGACEAAALSWQLLNPSGVVADLARVCDKDRRATTLGEAGDWTIVVSAATDGVGSYRIALERA